MLRYKIDVLDALDKRGYYPRKIREDGLLSESTMMMIRQGKVVSTKSLNMLCQLLNSQPGEIIEFVPSNKI